MDLDGGKLQHSNKIIQYWKENFEGKLLLSAFEINVECLNAFPKLVDLGIS